MKRFILSLVLAAMALSAVAQSNDGTLKFLGFPVDGSKQQMIENLKSKGFSYSTLNDYLTGQFNGEYVRVLIHTNHSIVDRIVVVFPSTPSKNEIKSRFNRLISQFDNNDKYFSLGENIPIPFDEDIAYELTVNDKQYRAGYYYVGDTSFEQRMNSLCDLVMSMLPEDDATPIVAAVNTFVDNPTEENARVFEQVGSLLLDAEWTPEKIEQFASISEAVTSIYNSLVWFTISREGDYNIDLYYDNRANMANGEDL